MKLSEQRVIEVWADWDSLAGAKRMGTLTAASARGKEVFAFGYDADWLKSDASFSLDPAMTLFTGPQYPHGGTANFGVFRDSEPNRWGKTIMKRREAQAARDESRDARTLRDSDYLLGVHDKQRLGALRFKTDPNGPFLDDNREYSSPPWTSLRELEIASAEIERPRADESPNYRKWIKMLIAPAGSLGGARPKAGVLDPHGRLWIAKFPSQGDIRDIGIWEFLVHRLARAAGIVVSDSEARRFNTPRHTFLTRRFDRTEDGDRVHFASALTLLDRVDGDDASTGASYLEMAELLMKAGAHPDRDMEQLWRRIVFFICVSNVDDHLRNHGFLLDRRGWTLAPAYDMNPDPDADGLKLNVSDSENAQDIDLALSVAEYYRVSARRSREIVTDVVTVVKEWRQVAASLKISANEIERLEYAFRVADAA